MSNSHYALIAVLTYRRPGDLVAILTELADQVLLVEERVDVLVVDNDPDASARDVVADFAERGPFRYAHEPVPGIAAARNRALSEATEYGRLIFIDDDERPGERWLPRLLKAHETFGSAAIVGPVISRYAAEPEKWILAGRFFERRRLPTGTVVKVAATNNLLLDLRTVRALGLQFDERFGITGGSDTLFTRQLSQRGATMVWCDDAVVFDVVPEKRLTRQWVLRRAYRSGNGWIRTELELERSRARRLAIRSRLAGAGATRFGGGLARYAIGAVAGRVGLRARGMRTMARGAGLLVGTVGGTYAEYGRDETRSPWRSRSAKKGRP